MSRFSRRGALKLMVAAGAVGAGAGCESSTRKPAPRRAKAKPSDAILETVPLSAPPWKTQDPFLFCVHHDDHYPKANAELGPDVSLQGRPLGSDFSGIDGWRMYHGRVVPGFPQHPHRGFETVTVVRRGLLDHSDSLGAAARYGGGDVQWLTAGSGILHAEMFPLLRRDADNPVELFQIWLNLPRKNKMVDPHFAMLWNETIPKKTVRDDAGRQTELTIVAGRYESATAPSPPPSSWAAGDNDVAIWTLRMQPGARIVVPPARSGSNRTLYYFRGSGLSADAQEIASNHRVEVRADRPLPLEAGPDGAELLLLQGRPIGEPVARHGPFVMNDQAEIRQAYADYRRTRFGGWPWPREDPVHGTDGDRFARHADGTVDRPA